MSSVEEVADSSLVYHTISPTETAPGWRGVHKWYERGDCPWCGTESVPAKEPPPPATEGCIEDIAEVLPPVTKLFGFGEMTDGD